jgi:uncharacterized protein YlxW (UPF0749 family)
MAVKRKVRHGCVMAADDPHFRLRLPSDLRDQLREAATANRRSINAEIVARLEATFPPAGFEQRKRYEILRQQRDDAARNLQDFQQRLARLEAEIEQLKPEVEKP